MSSLEMEEQVISEKHIPVDMEVYIKFKLGVQPPSTQDDEGSQPEEESAEQVRRFLFKNYLLHHLAVEYTR